MKELLDEIEERWKRINIERDNLQTQKEELQSKIGEYERETQELRKELSELKTKWFNLLKTFKSEMEDENE